MAAGSRVSVGTLLRLCVVQTSAVCWTGAVSVRVQTSAVPLSLTWGGNLYGNQTTRLSPVGRTCRYDDNLQGNYPPWKSPPRHVGSVLRLGGVWRMIALRLGTFMMCHSAWRKHPGGSAFVDASWSGVLVASSCLQSVQGHVGASASESLLRASCHSV